MHSSYTTVDGIELLINRVHRAAIDKFVAAHPEPTPPSRKVEIWGGVEEEIPDHGDITYQSEMQTHRLLLGRNQLQVLFPAIEVVGGYPKPDGEILALLGKDKLTDFEILKWSILADGDDLDQVVSELLYLSTVTPKGIEEAQQAFAVKWFDKEITAWKTPGLPAMNSTLFRDRKAAQFCGYTWVGFCELTGPEQSECVAFYSASQTMEYLSQKWRK